MQGGLSRLFLSGLAVLVAVAPAASGASEQGSTTLQPRGRDEQFVAGELIVQFRPGVSGAAWRDVLGSARVTGSLGVPGLTLVRLEDGRSVRASAAVLSRDPRVAFAEPNYLHQFAAVPPDDTRFTELWSLHQGNDADIDAVEAWDTTSGNANVVVGVIDTGVAYDHPDLAGNMWSHPVTGAPGRDFVDEDDTPLDIDGHGTHVAGTIGAVGNNTLGVTGVTWDVSIMALRAGALDTLESADIVQAIDYACANGAHVVNGAFSGSFKSAAIANAVNSTACADTLFVFAAGNDRMDLTPNFPSFNSFPCELHRPVSAGGAGAANVLCVGASTRSDLLATFSNRGPKSVHLVAAGGNLSGLPSQQILSTWPVFDTVWGPDDMETAGTWGDQINEGNPLAPSWDRRAGPATSGTFALSDSPMNYVNNARTTIRNMAPIDLSGELGCVIDHQTSLDTDLAFDFFGVSAGTDTFANEAEIGTWSGWTDGDFVLLTSDLSRFGGEPVVYVRFFLDTDGFQFGDGAYVDDVLVRCLQANGEDYQVMRGTSVASAHVTGVGALLLAAKPDLTVAKLKNAILKGVDKKAAFANRVSTGGRLNADHSIDVALDVTPPNTTINGRPPASTTSRRATFRFRSNEAGSTFQCRHMNGAWLSCTSPKLYTGLTLGLHRFRVRAIDRALNFDPTPASDMWRIVR